MAIARSIDQALERASWIRRMFEAGEDLKQKLGADRVFDFSLGNPILEPPPQFQRALQDLANAPPPGSHRYMANNGYLATREAVARRISEEQQVEVDAEDVVMTVGAAGAIHSTLHSLLDPGDEVIIFAPYFVEYLFYIAAHNGQVRIVETTEDFDIDPEAVAAAITERTKAIIVNTPNNPTGRIYSQQRMQQLAQVLADAERRWSHEIYLLADTPYSRITYDGLSNPLLFADHPNAVINHSHSKDLGLAGERIGYLVVSPRAVHRQRLRGACTFSNRVLGYVNAPALMQLAVARSIDATVDTTSYVQGRELLTRGLAEIGYQFFAPQGAFYLFPRCPIADDVRFTELLRQQNVLVVPGRGFGRAGHIRIAYCVAPETVERALPRFAEAFQRARQ
jgi:aspartate aminotransferase